MKLRSTLALWSIALFASPARTQCASWSDGYGAGGLNNWVYAFATYDDGSGPALYAGGLFDAADATSTGPVARWNGTSWGALPQSLSATAGGVRALAVYDDGSGPKLYAGGNDLLPGADVVAWDGSTWQPLAGGPDGAVLTLAVFAGQLYACGQFATDAGLASPNIVRWDGTAWSGVGGAHGRVEAAVVHDDGTGPALYVGGDFDAVGGLPAQRVARWNGTAWSSVGPPTPSAVYALAVHDFGGGNELVLAGYRRTARWDGASWTVMDATTWPTDWSGRALLSYGSGANAELVVGGSFEFLDQGAPNVARWNGSAWEPLGRGVFGAGVESLASFDDGTGATVFAGGAFFTAGARRANNVARWDGGDWWPAGSGGGLANATYPGIEAIERFDDGSGEALYVAGSFTGAGDTYADSITRFDGATWTNLGPVLGSLHALAIYDDDGSGPKLYAGGQYSAIGTATLRSLACFDGSTWSFPPTVSSLRLKTNVTQVVQALLVHDDGNGPALYVAGALTFVDGALTHTTHVARRRAGAWTLLTVGTPVFGTQALTLATHDDGNGAALYLGGANLPLASGLHSIAKWDGATWAPLGSGLVHPFGIADVHALTSFDDGTGPALYAGGSFVVAGGAPASNVARWKDGAWSALGTGTDRRVQSLAVFDEGTGRGPELVAGGQFFSAGGVATRAIARWDGASWSAVDGGMDDELVTNNVRVLRAFEDAGGRSLYAGGVFHAAGATASQNLARLDACGETGATYCFGDGSGSACPCGNASALGLRAGCLNSLSTGGTLRARGEASLSNDTLSLDGGAMTSSSALYFQGASAANGGAGLVFGDGLRCASGPFARLLTKTNVAGVSTYPDVGELAVSVKGNVAAPGTRHYQVRYRNAAAFCSSDTYNWTNAIEIVWRP